MSGFEKDTELWPKHPHYDLALKSVQLSRSTLLEDNQERSEDDTLASQSVVT